MLQEMDKILLVSAQHMALPCYRLSSGIYSLYSDKTEYYQEISSLHRIRERLLKQRTAIRAKAEG